MTMTNDLQFKQDTTGQFGTMSAEEFDRFVKILLGPQYFVQEEYCSDPRYGVGWYGYIAVRTTLRGRETADGKYSHTVCSASGEKTRCDMRVRMLENRLQYCMYAATH